MPPRRKEGAKPSTSGTSPTERAKVMLYFRSKSPFFVKGDTRAFQIRVYGAESPKAKRRKIRPAVGRYFNSLRNAVLRSQLRPARLVLKAPAAAAAAAGGPKSPKGGKKGKDGKKGKAAAASEPPEPAAGDYAEETSQFASGRRLPPLCAIATLLSRPAPPRWDDGARDSWVGEVYTDVRGAIMEQDGDEEGTVSAATIDNIFAVNATAPANRRAQLFLFVKVIAESITPLARNYGLSRAGLAPTGPLSDATILRPAPKAPHERTGYEVLTPPAVGPSKLSKVKFKKVLYLPFEPR